MTQDDINAIAARVISIEADALTIAGLVAFPQIVLWMPSQV